MKKKSGAKKKKKKVEQTAKAAKPLVEKVKQPSVQSEQTVVRAEQPTVNPQTIKMFATAAGVTIVVLALYCMFLNKKLDESNADMISMQLQIDSLEDQKELLISQKVEQDKKMTELSDTLNEKLKQEEELAKMHIPYGFPIKGLASYDSAKVELEGNPIAVFHASAGMSVTPTAVGKVSSVTKATSGYIVTVDHGNGYVSVYRNGARPKVQEGVEVTKETEIFQIEAGKEDLGYQIMENDKYIDPLGFMETYG